MVLLHVKKTDDLQFLFEAPAATPVATVRRDVVYIWNTLIKIRRACDSLMELAKYGPAKPVEKQGLDEYDENPPARGPYYVADPIGKRTGEGPEPRLSDVIMRQVSDALRLCNCKDYVERKEVLTPLVLSEMWSALQGAVTIAYPMGLPEYDEIRAMFEHDEFEPDSRVSELVPEAEAVMWWAGKQLLPGQNLSDFVGRNDKTKIVVKLTKGATSAPSREPVVDEATQKAMMAFYFKKQEEMKKLAEESDDAYLSSQWADPSALKAQLQGTAGVSWRGGGGARR